MLPIKQTPIVCMLKMKNKTENNPQNSKQNGYKPIIQKIKSAFALRKKSIPKSKNLVYLVGDSGSTLLNRPKKVNKWIIWIKKKFIQGKKSTDESSVFLYQLPEIVQPLVISEVKEVYIY